LIKLTSKAPLALDRSVVKLFVYVGFTNNFKHLWPVAVGSMSTSPARLSMTLLPSDASSSLLSMMSADDAEQSSSSNVAALAAAVVAEVVVAAESAAAAASNRSSASGAAIDVHRIDADADCEQQQQQRGCEPSPCQHTLDRLLPICDDSPRYFTHVSHVCRGLFLIRSISRIFLF
jgi:hypothetical protein